MSSDVRKNVRFFKNRYQVAKILLKNFLYARQRISIYTLRNLKTDINCVIPEKFFQKILAT